MLLWLDATTLAQSEHTEAVQGSTIHKQRVKQQEGGCMKSGVKVETTLGDLIVALTEEAARCVPDEQTACRVVAFILSDILAHTVPPTQRWH